MTIASEYVIKICSLSEKTFRSIKNSVNIYNTQINLLKMLVNKIMANIPSSLLNVFGDHLYDDEPVSNHGILLSELIITKYLNIRIHHEASTNNDKMQYRIRSLLTKTITFKNQ